MRPRLSSLCTKSTTAGTAAASQRDHGGETSCQLVVADTDPAVGYRYAGLYSRCFPHWSARRHAGSASERGNGHKKTGSRAGFSGVSGLIRGDSEVSGRKVLVPETGIEPATFALRVRCSTY